MAIAPAGASARYPSTAFSTLASGETAPAEGPVRQW